MRISGHSVLSLLLLCGILLICHVFAGTATGAPCGSGKRPLFYYTAPQLSGYLSSSFSDRLFEKLHEPLMDIGYCITRYDSTVLYDASVRDSYIMVVAPDSGSSGYTGQADNFSSFFSTVPFIQVALIRVDSWSRWEMRKALKTPLLSLPFSRDELSTFESVLIRKIEENLRMQYICHLSIQSVPDGARIRTEDGLEGIAPVDWIVPVGKVEITAELEGFKPNRRTIRLREPGHHTYILQMSEQQFFNSPFFVSSLVLGAVSIGSFGVDQYFYNKYDKLGQTDRDEHPELFAENYNRAKLFERIAGAAAILGGISFSLSFVF